MHGMSGYKALEVKKQKHYNNDYIKLIKDECMLLCKNFKQTFFVMTPMFFNEETQELAMIQKEKYFD